MANFDVIKPSYDAMQAMERTVQSLVYVSSIIPDEDEHAALFFLLADKLDQDFSWLKSEMIKLWPESSGADLGDSKSE